MAAQAAAYIRGWPASQHVMALPTLRQPWLGMAVVLTAMKLKAGRFWAVITKRLAVLCGCGCGCGCGCVVTTPVCRVKQTCIWPLFSRRVMCVPLLLIPMREQVFAPSHHKCRKCASASCRIRRPGSSCRSSQDLITVPTPNTLTLIPISCPCCRSLWSSRRRRQTCDWPQMGLAT